MVVRVERSGDALSVTVTSTPRRPAVNGPDAAAGAATGGTGLVGLDERVRLAGGVLSHGPLPDGGFEVAASLPLTPGPAVPARTSAGSTSVRELAERRQVRRRLKQAIWVPLAVTAALRVLLGAVTLAGPVTPRWRRRSPPQCGHRIRSPAPSPVASVGRVTRPGSAPVASSRWAGRTRTV
ncbi:hypothetical protein AB0M87_01340 [Streptomyces sp. NPDC051320]|uniref:hypothetical protein n=1 Tax=Streptomyces sp. NPDC051320 TaxID=3154644 RepID=UPI00341F4262